MIVRVRLHSGPRIRRQGPKNQQVALSFAALLAPAALMAYALSLWRLAADLRITSDFAIAGGLFSHWQVWLAVAVLLHAAAGLLNRYGRRGVFFPSDSPLRIPGFWPAAAELKRGDSARN